MGWLPGSRTRRLRKLASGLGLHSAASREVVDQTGLLATGLVEAGGRPTSVLTGEVRGFPAVLFEYSGRSGEPDPVVAFQLKEAALPDFRLQPRIRSEAPTGLHFEAHERFSDIYALSGAEEAALRALFSGPVLTFFERSENQDWAVVSTGSWLGITLWPLGQRRTKLDPKQIVAFVEDAKQVLFLLTNTRSAGK